MLTTESGNFKLTRQEKEEIDRKLREALERERAAKAACQSAEMNNNALTYTLRQMKLSYDDILRALQGAQGNVSKALNIVSATKLATDEVLERKQQ